MSDAPAPDPDLAAQVEHLERVAAQLGEDGLGADALRELAEEAVRTAERISRLLPQSLEPGDET